MQRWGQRLGCQAELGSAEPGDGSGGITCEEVVDRQDVEYAVRAVIVYGEWPAPNKDAPCYLRLSIFFSNPLRPAIDADHPRQVLTREPNSWGNRAELRCRTIRDKTRT